MLPAGNSQSMVLVGFGSNVVALANMLKIIDDASQTGDSAGVRRHQAQVRVGGGHRRDRRGAAEATNQNRTSVRSRRVPRAR